MLVIAFVDGQLPTPIYRIARFDPKTRELAQYRRLLIRARLSFCRFSETTPLRLPGGRLRNFINEVD